LSFPRRRESISNKEKLFQVPYPVAIPSFPPPFTRQREGIRSKRALSELFMSFLGSLVVFSTDFREFFEEDYGLF